MPMLLLSCTSLPVTNERFASDPLETTMPWVLP